MTSIDCRRFFWEEESVRGTRDMPKVVGGFAAMVALAGGILAQVDPPTSLWRAALAFMLGWVATSLWYVFFTVRVQPVNTEVAEAPAAPTKQGTA